MGTMITLMHNHHTLPKRVEFFYDGLVLAENGLLSLDSENVNHLRAAYFRGYQKTTDGRWLNGFTALDEYIKSETAKSEGTYEGHDTGRLTPTEDGVRSSERDSSVKISRGRMGSSVRSRTS